MQANSRPQRAVCGIPKLWAAASSAKLPVSKKQAQCNSEAAGVTENHAWDQSTQDAKTLELPLIVVRGKHMRRKTITLHDTYPSMAVSTVKEMVAQQLGEEEPSDIQIMTGTKVVADASSLSVFSHESQTTLRAVVWYDEPDMAMVWDESLSPAGSDWSNEDSPHLLTGYEPADDRVEQSSTSTIKQDPPPLLMRRGKGSQKAVENLNSEEDVTKCEEMTMQDSQVKVLVMGNILLGSHLHQRSCYVTVSPSMKVSGFKDLLTKKWLGSPPDELLVTIGGDSLKNDLMLSNYNVSGGAMLVLVAWYKHAVNSDLPAKSRAALHALG